MKLMTVNRKAGELSDFLKVDMLPDTAVLKNRKPFFLPDFSQQWEYRMAVAYRVSRLGKNIAPKFASRYYDAVTMALIAVPVDLTHEPQSSALATAFDDAVAMGEWVPVDGNEDLTLSVGGQMVKMSAADVAIDEVVSRLSRYFTFKIGDVVVPVLSDVTFPINLDMVITGEINNHEVLNIKIK